MAGLAKKLGIKSGQVVCLLNAPSEAAALLRQECPEGIFLANGARALTFSKSINGYMWEDFPTFAWPETATKSSMQRWNG